MLGRGRAGAVRGGRLSSSRTGASREASGWAEAAGPGGLGPEDVEGELPGHRAISPRGGQIERWAGGAEGAVQ